MCRTRYTCGHAWRHLDNLCLCGNFLKDAEIDCRRCLQKREDELPTGEDEVGEPSCIACMENKKKLSPVDCGHKVLCFGCAKKIYDSTEKKCPMCRANITKMIRIFDE